MREKSLSFRLLDTHVVAGRADDVAYSDAEGSLTFARLLHESAAVAGALNQLGVQPGGTVHLDLTGRPEVLAVLALVRLEVTTDPDAPVSLTGDPAVARVGDSEFAWDVLLKAGRGDPAPAVRWDSEGYAERALAEHGELLAPLLAGEPLTR